MNMAILPDRLQQILPILERGPVAQVYLSQSAMFASGYNRIPNLSSAGNIDAYNCHQDRLKDVPMKPQGAFHLVRILQGIDHQIQNLTGNKNLRLARWHLASRGVFNSGARLENSLAHYGIDYGKVTFSNGVPVLRTVQAKGGTILLTGFEQYTRLQSAQTGVTILNCRGEVEENLGNRTIVSWDHDDTIADSSPDRPFHTSLEAFLQHEVAQIDIPQGFGPEHGLFWYLQLARLLYPNTIKDTPLIKGVH